MTALSIGVVLALSARAEVLVKDLGAAAYRDREAAQAELLALGGPARAAVEKAVASPDPEVARRAKGLAKEIGFRLDCARLLAGTPVRLDFSNAPLSAVLLSLSKQSGYAVGVLKTGADPDAVKVTVRTGEVPFWKAVEEVGKAAGLTVSGLGADVGTVRYFTPDIEAAPQTPGEKVRAWAAEVEAMLRFANNLDVQARSVLEVYRNNLRQSANTVTALETAVARNGQQATIDRVVTQAENSYKAARNLFAAAGVRAPVGPNGRYPVVLGPVAGPTGSASAGVWVEPSTTTPTIPQLVKTYPTPNANSRPAIPGPTVYLRVVPEPKIEWVRTTGIRFEQATDESDRAVEPNLTSAPFGPNSYEEAMFLGGGRVLRKSYVSGPVVQPTPYYASVLLKGEAPAPTVLRTFRGAIQGVVKTAPEEVVARALTVDPKVGPGQEPSAPDLRVIPRGLNRRAGGPEPPPSYATHPVLSATVKQVRDGYRVEVVLQYSGNSFAPAGATGLNSASVSTQMVRVAQGQAVVIQQFGYPSHNGPKRESVYGLRVTDAEGRPFHLTGGIELTRTSPDGTGAMYAQLILTATASEVTKGPPARIAWHATRLAAVEVPFDLKNVPVVK